MPKSVTTLDDKNVADIQQLIDNERFTTQTRPYAFDTRGHFLKCKWKPVRIIAWTAWGMALVEFIDGHRDYKLNVEYRT